MIVQCFLDHLGSHVLECATVGQALALVCVPGIVELNLVVNGPAKITELDHVVVVDEQVFGLQISVDEAVLMQKVDASDRLDEVPEGLFFDEALALWNLHKKVLLGNKLHH